MGAPGRKFYRLRNYMTLKKADIITKVMISMSA